MPAALVTTVGDASANSYGSLAEANTYFDSRLNASAWTAASDDDKTRALLEATVWLDELFDWEGAPATDVQRLRFPRVGLFDRDGRDVSSDSIPDAIKYAQFDIALLFLTSNRKGESELLGQGMSRVKVGPIEVEVDDTQGVKDLLTSHIYSLVGAFGTPNHNAFTRSGVVRLRRT